VLQEVHIILVRPEQPRNVGSVVRAAANFGARSVRIVRGNGWDAEFERLAHVASAGAWEVVIPEVFPDLLAAAAGLDIIAATSARSRERSRQPLDPEFFFRQHAAACRRVGLVFGPEGQGLSADDFALCHAWLRIPSSDRFPSLNLGHSVAVLLYEADRLRRADTMPGTDASCPTDAPSSPAPVAEQEACLARWADLLDEIGLLRPESRARQLGQLRRLLQRGHPSRGDLALLESIRHKLHKSKS
jgi:TrmH family RNA methyltransferase